MSSDDTGEDLNQFDGDDGDESLDSSGSGTGDNAPQDDPKDSNRINDLMSKWQTADARANRAEAELKRLKGEGADGGDATPPSGESPAPAVDEGLMEILTEQARKALYDSDPRLARFGIKPEAITGSTAAEMRESLKRQVELIDAVEGKVRNEVMAEHGLTNDAAGGGAERPTNFNEMPTEDFLALIERVKAGG